MIDVIFGLFRYRRRSANICTLITAILYLYRLCLELQKQIQNRNSDVCFGATTSCLLANIVDTVITRFL